MPSFSGGRVQVDIGPARWLFLESEFKDPCAIPNGPLRVTMTHLGPARGLWASLPVGRLPLRVFSIGKYAFQKKNYDTTTNPPETRRAHPASGTCHSASSGRVSLRVTRQTLSRSVRLIRAGPR